MKNALAVSLISTFCSLLGLNPVWAAVNGPLRVSPTNPRYFTDDSGQAIYLAGSHTWNNLQDGGVVGQPPSLFVDFPSYLDFLQSHNHNVIRLWAYEGWEADSTPQFYEPLPYLRTGPGTALDGKPLFDLSQPDPEYFTRLRDRVAAAGDRGIYVSIMLFQGWSVAVHNGNPWPGHFFNANNNINGVDGDPSGTGAGDAVHTLDIPQITSLQEDYVRAVIDQLNEFDNVLFEISNEDFPTAVDWQNHMVDFIHTYEAGKPKQHPVGMTCNYTADDNASLFASAAEWVSPCASAYEDPTATYAGPIPAATGDKVMVLDTDHIGGQMYIDSAAFSISWAWRSFLMGHNHMLMDDLINPGKEPLRQAMGQIHTWASTIDLLNDVPHPELSSTGYALANPGQEYLVFQPDGGEFSVDLTAAAGSFSLEWFDPVTGATDSAGTVDGGAPQSFPPPQVPMVLYLKNVGTSASPSAVNPDDGDGGVTRSKDALKAKRRRRTTQHRSHRGHPGGRI